MRNYAGIVIKHLYYPMVVISFKTLSYFVGCALYVGFE